MEFPFRVTFDEETMAKLKALSPDLREAAFCEYQRVLNVRARHTMLSAIQAILPRCVKAGSVVHKQHGGRVYNRRCPKCNVLLIGKRRSRDPVSGKRWVIYSHPDTPLEEV